jgi:glycosyltransferase involved in cell wall biosynthesis
MPINIYVTSFFRIDMTLKTIDLLYERTYPGTFKLHVFDNGSDNTTKKELIRLLDSGRIESLHLDNRNTGCLYNKGIFYMMNESTDKYFCVTDNDVYPPKIEPDWLSQMITIMDSNSNIGMLAPQLPPQFLQQPFYVGKDIVKCLGIGNTLKIIRKDAFPVKNYQQALGTYGDDGLVSKMMRDDGWDVAFCRNIFCYHAGQCVNWGYTNEQINMDPRKVGYGKPFTYDLVNEETYEPEQKYRM